MEILVLFQILFALFNLFCLCLNGLENFHFVQGNEYSTLTDSLAFSAVYFHNEKAVKKFPEFEDHFMKAAQSLQSYGVTFVKTSCYASNEYSCSDDNLQTSSLGLFSFGKLVKRLPLEEAFNEDAIVAHILQAVLRNELRLIYSELDFQSLLDESKGVSNIVLGFVEGYGTTKHRYMMEVSFVYGDNFTFALTTDENLANNYKMPISHDARLWVFFCKEVLNKSQPCNSVQYNGKISVLQMASFIQLQTLPRAVLMPKDGVTIYDKVKLPISKVYLFNDEFTEKDLNQLSLLSKELPAAVGFVLVNIKERKSWLPKFGLSDGSHFPAIAFVPPFSSSDGIPINVDVITDDQVSMTFPNVRKMITNYLENPEKFQEKIIQSSSLKVIDIHDYEGLVLSGMKAERKTLAAFCPKGYTVCDRFFAREFRRLVRSLDKDSRVDMAIVFVICTEDSCRDVLNIHEFPTLRLHTPHQVVENGEEFYTYKRDSSFHAIILFVEDKLGLTDIVSVPPSPADDVPFFPGKDDEEVEEELEEHDEEEELSKPTEENNESSEENQDVDVPIQESSEDQEPEYGLSKEETEDDEVAGAVNKFRTWFIKEEKVPMLTDKSFNTTRNTYDVLVVHFFMPWDSRSEAFKEPYAQVAQTVAMDKNLPLKTVLAGVNCFDWPDVCEKSGIIRYPTVMLYTPDGHLEYKGPFEEKSLWKTVKLLQHPAYGWPVMSLDEAEAFLYDEKYLVLGDIVLIGLFTENNQNEMMVFKSVASKMYGQFLIILAKGNIAREMGRKFDVQTPSIVLFKKKDPIERFIAFSNAFTMENIMEFIIHGQLPVFGQLTPANLPVYVNHYQQFVIVFRGEDDQMYSPSVTQIIKTKTFPHVNFCWMNGSDNTGAELLKVYTKDTVFPALVFIDFTKSEVHHYKSSSIDVSEISNWIKHCLSSHNEPTDYLQYGQWKPVLPGYDFLAMIAEEGGQEMNKEKEKEEDEQKFGEVKSNFEERKHSRKMRRVFISGAHEHHHTEL